MELEHIRLQLIIGRERERSLNSQPDEEKEE